MQPYFIFLYCLICAFTAAAQRPPQLIPFRDGDRWGYADTTGRIVVPVQYEEAWPFVTRPEMFDPYYSPDQDYTGWPALENPIGMVKKNGLYGLLDAHGRELTRPVSPEVFSFYPINGTCYAVVYDGKDSESGVFDRHLAILTASGLKFTGFKYHTDYGETGDKGEYTSVELGHYSFYESPPAREPVPVRQGNHEGLVSAFTGEELIPVMWHSVTSGPNGRHFVYTYDTLPEYGAAGHFIVANGNKMLSRIPYDLSYIRYAGFGLFEAHDREQRVGFLNDQGALVIPFHFDEVYGFNRNGVAKVHTSDGMWQLIDTTGAVRLRLGAEGHCVTKANGYSIKSGDGKYYIYDRHLQQHQIGLEVEPEDVFFCGSRYYTYWDGYLWHLMDSTGKKELSSSRHGFNDTINGQTDESGRWFPIRGMRIRDYSFTYLLDCNATSILPPCTQFNLLYGPNWWKVEQNGKVGVYDTRLGKMIIPAQYDHIRYDPKGAYFSVKDQDYWGQLDTSGKELAPVIFEQEFFRNYNHEYKLVRTKNGWYVKDDKENFTPLPPGIFDDPYPEIYNYASLGERPFYCITARVKGRRALFDLFGKTLIPPDYDYLEVTENYVLVRQNGKWGALSFPELKEILPLEFLSLQLHEGEFLVKRSADSVSEIYDPKTHIFKKEPKNYHIISRFSEGRAVTRTDCIKLGYIDTTFKIIIPSRFIVAYPFHHGFALVIYKNEADHMFYAFIDRDGRELITVSHKEGGEIKQFGSYYIVSKAEDQHTILDSLLRPVLENCIQLDVIGGSNPRLQCYCDGKAGIFTYDGRLSPDESGYIYEQYPNGYTGVSYLDAWGLRDPKGNWSVPISFQSAKPYPESDRFITIRRSGGLGIFDIYGKEILPCQFTDITQKGNYWEVSSESGYGVYTLNGRMVVPALYDQVDVLSAIGLIKVTDQDSGIGFYDFQGRRYFR